MFINPYTTITTKNIYEISNLAMVGGWYRSWFW